MVMLLPAMPPSRIIKAAAASDPIPLPISHAFCSCAIFGPPKFSKHCWGLGKNRDFDPAPSYGKLRSQGGLVPGTDQYGTRFR